MGSDGRRMCGDTIERALYEAAIDALIDDAIFEAARNHLSARQTVELVTAVAYYNMVARFLVGLKIDLET